MCDFVSLVLSLPATVDGIVKTCRKLHDYQNLENDHKAVVERAEFGCRKFAHYLSYVDTNAPKANSPGGMEAEQRQLLEDAVFHANGAMENMAQVVIGWSIRLGMTETTGRVLMASLAAAISEKLMKKSKTPTVARLSSPRAGKGMSKFAYLAMGRRQISDAVDAMERWTDNIRDVLLSTQNLKPLRKPFPTATSKDRVADDVSFVASCLDRAERAVAVVHIDSTEVSVYSDLDPTHPTGFYTIDSGDYMGCIIDRRDVNYLIQVEKEAQAEAESENIARLFAEERSGTAIVSANASAGILPCCGWAKVSTRFMSTEHDLVFRPPPGKRVPRTLRMLLLDGPARHPLNERVRFSIELATSVLITHSLGLVHKDVRPDSILVFDPLVGKEQELFPYRLGRAYLGNFDRARSENVDTVINPFQYSPYMRTAYTHPRHTTSTQHFRYRMRDDIYGLGVVLIEIALWKSLFKWSDFRKCYDADFSWFDFSIEKYKKDFLDMGQPEYRNRGWLMRCDLIDLAEREIPIVMGKTFADVVISCLTLGEPSKPTFEDSVMKVSEPDHDVRGESIIFVQQILSKLRGISLS